MTINNKSYNKKLMLHTFRVAVIIILLSASSHAQTKNLVYFNNAEELYNSGDYFTAAKNYEYFLGYETPPKDKNLRKRAYIGKLSKARSHINNENVALYRLAESYYKLPSYYKAELYAEKAIKTLSLKEYPLSVFWYATALKANGKFAESSNQFTQFIKSYPKKDEYLTKAQLEMQSLDFINTQSQIPMNVSVKVDKIAFESEAAYGLKEEPVGNGILFTATSKTAKDNNEIKYQTSVYHATIEEGGFANISHIFPGFEENLMQYGEAVISRDSNYLFFTGTKGIPGIAISAIYQSKREGNKWSTPVLVQGGVNVEGYSSRQPMLTMDGKYLYFSSDRPGGQGKYDIWVSTIDANHNTMKTINAGKVINTSDDESCPFYHDKSHNLFFSSKGRIGMGGFDVYQAKGTLTSWERVTNLGKPYNSIKDDLYFFAPQDTNFNEESYFSSDRNTDCCLELFKATAPQTTRVIEIATEIPTQKLQKTDSLIVYFDFDESKLGENDSNALTLFAKQITDKFFEIEIGGFTDGMGTVDYNMALAKRRIESCIEILKQNGIEQKHFVITVGGECCPVEKETFEDGSDNPAARSKNRRVTLKLIE